MKGPLLLMFALMLATRATPTGAQVTLETEPATPVRGTLVRLRVTPANGVPIDGVEGEVAAEPLHFGRSDEGVWSSLVGIPISGGDSVAVTLILRCGDQRDTVRRGIGVMPGDYPVEELAVAPRLAEPDSAARVRIARETARARRVSRAAHDTPRLWREPFQRPANTRITSHFGAGRTFNGRIRSRHLGTDFNGLPGDPVHATNAGRVVLVATFYLAGRVVYLDHGEGLVSAYFHLSRSRVKTGDEVSRGQVIGEVGQSGRVTGPHLHWVMRYGTTTVDPMSVVGLLGEDAVRSE